ncbi:fibroblast growth factor receptor 2-like [Mya arenaria]|uniref:fibroblast growth factor receptor 2-like n=1 Tax=Mya arenaria TaxID=6604 RepID=UPI0022E2F8EF|nr:fibroblast growth factor receptor 2-like [Mya arenaria]
MRQLILTCSAEGNPSPSYYWMYMTEGAENGIMLGSGNQYTLNNLTLEETGIYTCVAYNEIKGVNQTVNASTQITIKRSPHSTHPPVGVTANSTYIVKMTFYSDSNFLNTIAGNPLQVTIGTDIYIKVFTPAADWSTEMRLQSCYVKPATNSTAHLTSYLIKDG